MFDLLRLGLPSIEDAHGKKWLCLYQASSDDQSIWYVAVEADSPVVGDRPHPCFLIAVPRKKPKLDAVADEVHQ